MGSALSSKTEITSWVAGYQMHVLATGNLDRRMKLENLFVNIPTEATAAGFNSVHATFGAAFWPGQNNPTIPDAMEPSILIEDGVAHIWFRSTDAVTPGYADRLFHGTATNEYYDNWVIDRDNPVLPAGWFFPTVFKVGDTYYMAVVDRATTLDLFLWSASAITGPWTIANGGNAILTHSPTTSDWWHQIFNSTICVIGTTWHLLIEGKADGEQFHVGYSSSTLAAGPNFNTNLSAAPVLPDSYDGVNCANPTMYHVPDRNAVLVVTGAFNRLHLTTRAVYAADDADLSSLASWHVAPGLGFQFIGKDIGDPILTFSGGTKPWGVMFAGNYNQLSMYQFYGSIDNITDFYDAVTDPIGELDDGSSGLLQTTGACRAGEFRVGYGDDIVLRRYQQAWLEIYDDTDGSDQLMRLTVGRPNGAGIDFMDSLTVPHLYTPAGVPFAIQNAGLAYGNQLVLDDAGNIGIGTTTIVPRAKLEIRVDGTDFIALSNPNIAHGMTDWWPTDVFATVNIFNCEWGGLQFRGISEGSIAPGLEFAGFFGKDNPANDLPAVRFIGAKKLVSTPQALGDDEMVAQWRNYTTPIVSLLGSGYLGIGVNLIAPSEQLQVDRQIALSHVDEGYTAKLTRRCARELVTLSGATKATTLNISSGARLLAVQLCVDTAVTDDGGDDTWSAAFSGGSTTAIVSGAAAAKQTKVNLQIVDEITSGTTNITFTPNGGSFTAGVIEVLVYYETLTAMANAA